LLINVKIIKNYSRGVEGGTYTYYEGWPGPASFI